MSYEVNLLRPKSSDEGAVLSLASAIAKTYGVPAQAVMDRLAVGGFRVKSNADLDTAKRYVRDLQRLGAICEVRDSSTGELVGGEIAEISSTPAPLPPKPVRATTHDEPGGLAAASGSFQQDLGALDNLSLATLDGQDDDEPIPLDLSLPPEAQTDSIPAVVPSAGNAFGPPTQEVAEEELMLAEDPRRPVTAGGSGTMAAALPVAAEVGPSEPGAPIDSVPLLTAKDMVPSHRKPAKPSLLESVAAVKATLAARGRKAFIAGVVVSALVGLLFAHIVGVFQETSAYAPARNDLRAAYGEATSADSYAALPEIRAGTVDLVQSRQRKIAVTGLMVWLILSGAAAVLWFRIVPWERLAPDRLAKTV